MASVSALYNSLPSVEAAHARLHGHDGILSTLAPLFAQYSEFGVCLVHAHCILDDKEMMIARGDISEPSRDTASYPERWLASGVPYEFTSEPTKTPPSELFDAFRAIVGDIGILGLFYAGKLREGTLVERTEGRRNITELVNGPLDAQAGEYIETAWLPNQQTNPVKMVCRLYCPIKQGVGHTKIREHYDHQEQLSKCAA